MSLPRNFAQSASFRATDEHQTATFAREIGARLGPGDAVLLSGEIGAGKSFLARALILDRLAREDRVEDVPSPTFTLVQTYELADCDIWHADLYRLGDASEIAELGLEDAFATSISLVEWAEKLGARAPRDALWIMLRATDQPGERVIDLAWDDPKLADRLAGISGLV